MHLRFKTLVIWIVWEPGPGCMNLYSSNHTTLVYSYLRWAYAVQSKWRELSFFTLVYQWKSTADNVELFRSGSTTITLWMFISYSLIYLVQQRNQLPSNTSFWLYDTCFQCCRLIQNKCFCTQHAQNRLVETMNL